MLSRRPGAAPLPDWDEIRLESRATPFSIEFCLLHRGRLSGWARARADRSGRLRWLEPPAGPAWARALLEEATDLWAGERGGEEVPPTT